LEKRVILPFLPDFIISSLKELQSFFPDQLILLNQIFFTWFKFIIFFYFRAEIKFYFWELNN
jgi:hypothetical protein